MEVAPPSDERLRCPVCSQLSLTVPPYAKYDGTVPTDAMPPYENVLGRASYEVCPVCAFEFGNDDNPGTAAPESFEEYRRKWEQLQHASSQDLRSLLPLLERPRSDASLDHDEAQRLVAYGLTAWSDWWASKALDWVAEGVWSEDVAQALRRTAEDQTCSQATRHRAQRYVKHPR